VLLCIITFSAGFRLWKGCSVVFIGVSQSVLFNDFFLLSGIFSVLSFLSSDGATCVCKMYAMGGKFVEFGGGVRNAFSI